MPAVLAHTGIMLLARDRVEDIRDRLLRKKAAARVPLTDLELRILRLATLTHILMSDADDTREAPDTPPEADWPSGIGRGVSRFSVMGSMGPDIPGLSAILAPAQGVWFDTVHKGTPDSQREQINARTHDFALALWRRGSDALTARPAGGADAVRARERARNQLRAYVLGHLTHLAGDIISHPFINDVEWHVPSSQPPSNPFSFETFKFGHEKTEGSLDTRVAIEFFRREGPRSGQAWSAWWPTVDEVPAELFVGYERALADIYGATAANRRKGLAVFEAAIAVPPLPDADFFRDGYRTLTKGGVDVLYNWGYASWLGFLSLAVVPALATFPLAFALPRGNDWFETDAGTAGERAAFEVMSLPLALNALWPLIYGGVVASITWRGAEEIAVTGLIGASLSTLAGVTYFITLATPDIGPALRWLLLFALPAAIGLGMTIAAIVKWRQKEKRRALLLLLLAAPFVLMVGVALLLLLFSELIGMASETAGAVSWGVLSGLIVVVGLILLFIWLPFKARDERIPEEAFAFPAMRPHHVRLFDRSSLFDLPQPPNTSELHYPSSVRPLLKLWWTGAGELFIRPRHTHIEYKFADDNSLPGIIPTPITPMTQRQLADYLTNAVRDSGNAANVLHCAVVHATDADVEIPPGAVFADHGEVREDAVNDRPEFELSSAAATFKQLTRENNESSYVLFHAPKRAQSVRFDRFGPVPFDDRESESVVGPGTISGSGITITGVDTSFRIFFRPGDRVVFGEQARIVTKVDSDVSMIISSPFRPAPTNGGYQRLGSEIEQTRGYSFVAQPRPRSGTGDTIMDIAGDLGALFCMAGASHMLDANEASIPDLANMVGPGNTAVPSPNLAPVAQVFRNWSLDRRLVEEWREAVIGGATIDNTAAANAGNRVLAQQGWIQTMRKWLRVVDVHDVSAVHATRRDAGGANEPTNRDLSLAMAKLLSMPDPIVVTPRP